MPHRANARLRYTAGMDEISVPILILIFVSSCGGIEIGAGTDFLLLQACQRKRRLSGAASFHFKPLTVWLHSRDRPSAGSKGSIGDKPNCERTPRQGAAEPIRE